jgi:hypothetical protein
MRTYIREMIDDIRRKRNKKAKPPVINLTPAPAPVLPKDLENQILSTDPAERVRQLDFQAQEQEEGVPLD